MDIQHKLTSEELNEAVNRYVEDRKKLCKKVEEDWERKKLLAKEQKLKPKKK